jgi:flagella basal body P-ring formation protein FlgA
MVTFKSTAEVKGAVILLSDVAAVEGQDPKLVESMEVLEVGAAPLSGRTRTVSAAYARVRLRQLRLGENAVTFAGAPLCTVSRPVQIVPGADLQKAACDAVDAVNPGAASQASYTPADLRLPVGAVELKPQGVRLLSATTGTVPVQVLVDGEQQALVTINFRLLRRAAAVVATRDLRPGSVVSEDDVKVEERPVTSGPLVLGVTSLAVGQQVAIPIKGGTVVTSAMLKPALAVKRGMRVKLICQGESFTVTAAGEALQDAAAGQTVRVRNLGSLLEVVGVAMGPETVRVPF